MSKELEQLKTQVQSMVVLYAHHQELDVQEVKDTLVMAMKVHMDDAYKAGAKAALDIDVEDMKPGVTPLGDLSGEAPRYFKFGYTQAMIDVKELIKAKRKKLL